MNLMPFQEQPFNGDRFIEQEFLKIKSFYNVNTVVETGSCLYSTTSWLGKNFDKVHTVEINQDFANYGIHKVKEMPNVVPDFGDSVQFLTRLVPTFKKEDVVLYFLDAHWGDSCPLINELNALILSETEFPPIVAIHDFKTETDGYDNSKLGFDEYNGQPFTYDWIKPYIKQLEFVHKCNYKHYYNTDAEGAMRGIIYLIPVKNWVHEIEKHCVKKHSQTGEEGYIEFILSNIPEKGKHLVELGAWDGYHLSNTRQLIDNGYTALLIDGDNRGNDEVKQHMIYKENILEILAKYKTPTEFDLLVIDLDGNDLYILEEVLSVYRPSLIVAEYNPIWAAHESKVIQYNKDHVWGSNDYYGFSYAAGVKMAEKYGYACVFENDSLNMYFVRKDFLDCVPTLRYTTVNYHPHAEGVWLDY